MATIAQLPRLSSHLFPRPQASSGGDPSPAVRPEPVRAGSALELLEPDPRQAVARRQQECSGE